MVESKTEHISDLMEKIVSLVPICSAQGAASKSRILDFVTAERTKSGPSL